jgi:hypothetical protein
MLASAESVRLADAFLHVWQAHVPNNGTARESAVEVELIGSHTSDPSHLDPSCPACRRLRSELLSIAQEAVQRVTSAASAGITFDVYAGPACIVCSPGDGQRPCVTVTIYVGSRSASSAQNGFPAAVGQIRQALGVLGVRQR